MKEIIMEEKISVDEFINSRENLSDSRKTMLKYLESVSDTCYIHPAKKGVSKVVCDFDCGAYQGREVITLNMKYLNPFSIFIHLMDLTSGHSFCFDEMHKECLRYMEENTKEDE